MKKFFISLFCVMLFASSFAFAGCSNDEYDGDMIDLSKMEIGAKIPVYPNCEFDYVLTPYIEGQGETQEEYIFHISSITASLTKKNSIHEGDVLTEPFYPFEIQVDITGHTSQDLAGYTASVMMWHTSLIDLCNIRCLITPSGEFSGSITLGVYDAQPALLYFANISNYLF